MKRRNDDLKAVIMTLHFKNALNKKIKIVTWKLDLEILMYWAYYFMLKLINPKMMREKKWN